MKADRSDQKPLSNLRESIAGGTYAVDSRKVADSIIRYIAVTGERLEPISAAAGRSPLPGDAPLTG